MVTSSVKIKITLETIWMDLQFAPLVSQELILIIIVNFVHALHVEILNSYILKQSSFWLLFYSVVLFWSTTFPFHYKETKANGKLKYFYIASVGADLILPLDAGVLLIGGFYVGSIPYSGCIAINTTYYYIYSVEQNIIIWMSCSLLLLISWTIFKV